MVAAITSPHTISTSVFNVDANPRQQQPRQIHTRGASRMVTEYAPITIIAASAAHPASQRRGAGAPVAIAFISGSPIIASCESSTGTKFIALTYV